jgi:hypothetical protein
MQQLECSLASGSLLEKSKRLFKYKKLAALKTQMKENKNEKGAIARGFSIVWLFLVAVNGQLRLHATVRCCPWL